MAGVGAKPGNQNAAKGREFEGALKRALVRSDGSLNKIADKLVALSIEGEQWAIQMLADRLDGKPKQATEISGPDGGAIPIEAVDMTSLTPEQRRALAAIKLPGE